MTWFWDDLNFYDNLWDDQKINVKGICSWTAKMKSESTEDRTVKFNIIYLKFWNLYSGHREISFRLEWFSIELLMSILHEYRHTKSQFNIIQYWITLI